MIKLSAVIITLNEEKNADIKLSEVATTAINVEAAAAEAE